MVGPSNEDQKGPNDGPHAGGLRAILPPRSREAASSIALSVNGLEGATLRNLSFEVRDGEIVGIAGLSDSGVTELTKILAGLHAPAGGRISVGGTAVPQVATPRMLIGAGMVVLPADRLRSGGIASLSVAENVLLPDLTRFWMNPRREIRIRATHRQTL